MSDHQARFDALIEKTREEYGDAAAESARRIADATLNLNSQSGSDLSFLGSSANRVVMMESSQAACEAFCEHFCVVDHPWLRALHMVIAASQEAQKVAETALRDCAGWFTQEPDGAGPLGTTHNADFLDPATAPVVYASSRIRERWVIGPSQSFGDVARLLATDARCDLSVVPFSTNLERYRFDAGRDCVAQLAEFERAYFKCLEMQMEPTWVVGELFPVAFGSQVVFLKFCSGHLSAFCRKYEIDFNECQILEPWENEGNHW